MSILFWIASVLIVLGYTLRYFSGPMVTFHLEWITAAGWLLTFTAFFLQVRPKAITGRWDMLLLMTVPAILLLTLVIDGASGRTEYAERSILYGMYLIGATLVAWLGFESVSAYTAPDPVVRDAGETSLSSVTVAVAGAALLSAMSGTAQYVFLPIPDWLVFPLRDAGRVYANLRQPNHFATLMALGVVAVTGLAWQLNQRAYGFSKLIRLGVPFASVVWLGVACAMSASRTGMLMLWIIAVMAAVGRALPGIARWLPLAAAAAHSLAWNLFIWLDERGVLPFFAVVRPMVGESAAQVGQRDISGTRFDIWRGLYEVTRQQGWFGGGWGSMNYEYFIHEVPKRMSLNLQNAHNVVLQMAIEQGWLVTLVCLATLVVLAWRARMAWMNPVGRLFLLASVAIGIHSCLEYPLWYSYFLFPAAFAFGGCYGVGCNLARSEQNIAGPLPPEQRKPVFLWAALGMTTLLTVYMDYAKILPLFRNESSDVMTRLERAYQTRLFTNLVDYGAVANTPVTRQNAQKHYELSKRAIKVRIDASMLVNLAIASSYLGKQDEAVFYLSRMRQISVSSYDSVISKLLPEEQEALTEALRLAATKQ